MNASMPRIVVIGGGSGCPTVLRGLKSRPVRLTAVVTTMDSGGSSGRLRRLLKVPALGDLRRALAALAGEGGRSRLQTALSEYRFEGDAGGDADIAGHSLGNLLLAALADLEGGVQAAADRMADLLEAQGQALPVTLERADLWARLQDGSLLEGEAAIDLRGRSTVGIERVWLSPPVAANPRALTAIGEADALVLGPGDLYTSVVPNLLVEGIAEAVRNSSAKTIVVANLATKPGETDGYRLSDFLRTLLSYLGSPVPIDAVVLDSGAGRAAGGEADQSLQGQSVEQDLDRCGDLVRRVVRRPVARGDVPWLHDPGPTADAVMEALSGSR